MGKQNGDHLHSYHKGTCIMLAVLYSGHNLYTYIYVLVNYMPEISDLKNVHVHIQNK